MRGKTASGERSRMKLRIIDGDRIIQMEVEGTDTALSEQMRNLAGALQSATTGRGQLPPAQRTTTPPAVQRETEVAEEDEQAVDEPDAVAQPPADADAGMSRPRRPRSKASIPKPKIVSDLDLSAGDMPFKKYCTGLALDAPGAKHTNRYLMLAQWLKDHRQIEKMNLHHAYTAYRFMQWSFPEDFSQPLKDMARKNAWFSTEEGSGLFVINHIGEEQVRQLRASASPAN
jgi:hypothetical protein